MSLHVRKIVTQTEVVCEEMGQKLADPTRKVTVAAVIGNPLAGRYEEDLTPLVDQGKEVAELLARHALEGLGEHAHDVRAYGKGAIVGLDGEIEHAAAVIHPKFGAPVRAAVGGGRDIIPSTKKVAGAGASIVVPVTNKDDIWHFDDMDSAEISIPDAPRPNEIVVVLALATGGRPLHRVQLPQ